ncbi:hypothetical protein SUNI508_09485 [Seiridium unicorne]|uniref:Uncharacterized protein n=1 Tax=Seiridium unicorne TaxID=138068 RepID=A0ABR2UQH4_9PEZI
MKFLQVLGYVTLALALPSPAPLNDDLVFEKLDKRANTASGVIVNQIGTLITAANTDISNINTALATIRQNTNAAAVVQAQATVKANYQAILNAIKAATNAIATATTGAAGGVAGSVVGLSQAEVTQLINSVNQAVTLFKNIQATLTVTATNLTPAAQAAISAELSSLRAAVQPFSAPITTFAQFVAAASVTARLTVSGLGAAVKGLAAIATTIAQGV